MNTHMLLEAFTNYYRLAGTELARALLVELVLIESNAVLRKSGGANTDGYALDSTPLEDRWHKVVYYGHDLENAWLLMQACHALDLPNGRLIDLYCAVWANNRKYGYDHEKGGVYNWGPLGEEARGKEKVFWVQGESMLGALHMYRLTGDSQYWTYFSEILRWIVAEQVDWENGEWFEQIDVDGSRSGVKAGEWKAVYHHGRAVVECLRLLREMEHE